MISILLRLLEIISMMICRFQAQASRESVLARNGNSSRRSGYESRDGIDGV